MKTEHLPAIVPIFPLTGALLLPFGQLPLNIFEPRYVSLIEDALGTHRLLGMIQPRGAEGAVIGDNGDIFDTGCLGRITEFTDPGDGRYEIVLTGLCRFKVEQELELYNGYRRVKVCYETFLKDLDPCETEITNRESLIEALRQYFDRQSLDADWDTLKEVPDSVLVTTAAMGCPLKPEEKQLLLEASDLSNRAENLQAILEIAIHGKNATTARH